MTIHQLTTGHKKVTDARDICLFGLANFRGQMRRFGIKTDDRRRHMYIIGKTGMGKSTVMENMMLSDIYNGRGVGLVDPHGDFAEKMIDFIPPERINDVVYVNPADVAYPMGFNILEVKNEEQKHLVVGGLMGTFKKIWPDAWSSRMEYILNHTLFCLIENPGSTLMGINRLLADKKYRSRMVHRVQDPVVKAFWLDEFAGYSEKYATEAVAPIQNKIGQFLSASVIRNMVAQVKSTFGVREAMDTRKILIMNLSKGRIGEDNSRLLGGMLITKIQLSAMERVDTEEHLRKDFFLYVDEFQNFANPSFANILSEARKYRLSLIMAHQYVKQLDEVVADAVFGNVGTMLTFRVGAADAEALVKEFTPTFTEEDIVNLPKFQIFLKLMIDGVASQPFSANTMPPIGSPTESEQSVINASRDRYAKERAVIEDKIRKWSEDEGGGIPAPPGGDPPETEKGSGGGKKKNRDERTPEGSAQRRAESAADRAKAEKKSTGKKESKPKDRESKDSTSPKVEKKEEEKKFDKGYTKSSDALRQDTRDERTPSGSAKRRKERSSIAVSTNGADEAKQMRHKQVTASLADLKPRGGRTSSMSTPSDPSVSISTIAPEGKTVSPQDRHQPIKVIEETFREPAQALPAQPMPLFRSTPVDLETTDEKMATAHTLKRAMQSPDEREAKMEEKQQKGKRERKRDERTASGAAKRRTVKVEELGNSVLDRDPGQSYIPDLSTMKAPGHDDLPVVRSGNTLTDPEDKHTSPDDIFNLHS